jgi:hypothetical protein
VLHPAYRVDAFRAMPAGRGPGPDPGPPGWCGGPGSGSGAAGVVSAFGAGNTFADRLPQAFLQCALLAF